MDISQLFSIYEKEKKNPNKIEKIPENFYKKSAEIVKKYKKLLEKGSPDSDENRRLSMQLDNIKSLLKLISDIRLEKILKLSLFEVKENIKAAERNEMSKEEQVLFDLITAVLKSYYNNIIKSSLSGENPNLDKVYEEVLSAFSKKVKNIDKLLVVFKQDLSPIVDPEGRIYGPFNAGDIYIINPTLGKRLIELGACEESIIGKE